MQHAEPPPTASPHVWRIGWRVCLLLALLLVVYLSRQVIAWMLIALLVALALAPMVAWLEKRRVRHAVAVAIVVIGLMAFLGLTVMTLVPLLVEQAHNLQEAVPELVARAKTSPLVAWSQRIFPGLWSGQAGGEQAAQAAGPIIGFLKGVFTSAAGFVSIVVLTIFMLLSGREVVALALEWVHPDRRADWRRIGERMSQRVAGYVLGSCMIAVIGGLVTAVTLLCLGVPYFLPLGMVMTIFALVPYVGTLCAGVVIALLTWGTNGLADASVFAAILVVYQMVENNVLQPVIQRKTIDMNPLMIVVVMLIGSAVSGLLGALLALPLSAAFQVLLEERLERRRAAWGGAAARATPPQTRPTVLRS